MAMASSRYFRSWRECGLNADMALWAGFDPERKSADQYARGFATFSRRLMTGASRCQNEGCRVKLPWLFQLRRQQPTLPPQSPPSPPDAGISTITSLRRRKGRVQGGL